MSERHFVASTREFDEEGERIISEVGGQEIAIFQYKGDYYAVANYCIHQSGPLCEGRLTGRIVMDDDQWDWSYVDEGRCIVCPWHGWTFDIVTGENVNDNRYKVPTYDVEVDGEDIFIVR